MQFTNIKVKRGIFTFDEDDFHIALMHNYKQGKICIFVLNKQDVISGNKYTLSETPTSLFLIKTQSTIRISNCSNLLQRH